MKTTLIASLLGFGLSIASPVFAEDKPADAPKTEEKAAAPARAPKARKSPKAHRTARAPKAEKAPKADKAPKAEKTE